MSLYDWISCCSREQNKTAFKKPTAGNENHEAEEDESSLPQELSVEDGVSSPLLPSCDPVDIPVGVFRFAPEHPLYKMHAVRVCTACFRAIPNFSGASLPRRDAGDREYYCATMLTLFKPWRSGASLKTAEQSWDDAFSAHSFATTQCQYMNNMHLKYECVDAQDDYHALFKKNAVALPVGIPFREEVLMENHDEGLDDLNTSGLLQDQALNSVLGKRQERKNKQTGVIRSVLDRVGWTKPLSFDLPSFMAFTSDVKSIRHSILLERESSPDPVQRTDPYSQTPFLPPSMEVYTASKDYLEKKFHSKNDRTIISQISMDFCLNKEQDCAFRIIANHICNPYSEQLKMYIGGMGGTSKSRVLHALLAFLHHRNELHRCVVVAPTGSATALL